MDFPVPDMADNPAGWGPWSEGPEDDGSYVEVSVKYPTAKLGRVCDFTQSAQERRKQDHNRPRPGQAMIPPPPEEDGYSLVDTKPVPKTNQYARGKGRGGWRPRTFFGGKGGKGGKGWGRQMPNYQEGILGQKAPKPFYQNNPQQKGGGKGFFRGQQRNRIPTFRDWSINTKQDWVVRQEIMLSSLSKVQVDARLVVKRDVAWCGTLGTYDRNMDRVTVRNEKPMQRFETTKFFNVSVSDDPMAQELVEQHPDVTVLANDKVLAVLMAASRSVYSWDIVITKIGTKIILDKRDGSHMDFLTVGETSNDPPSNEDKENINAPLKLGQEASCINQNFSQMIFDQSKRPEEMPYPNPFDVEDDDQGLPSIGSYRYRKITLPGNPKDEEEHKQGDVNLLVRTEVNAKAPRVDGQQQGQYYCVRALSEYDVRSGWRAKLESQRGAVFADELKNNAFKIGRWTAEAILGGCDLMKIGYVARVNPKDNWNHTLLAVQTYNTEAIAKQIGMTETNAFGILRSLIDIVMGMEEGKYLLLKDPTKSVMRLYEVPWDSFESEAEAEEGPLDPVPEEQAA